jgi:hypothetical protein
MRSLALRLLSLIAIMLMPFGMSAATAAPVHHEHAGAMSMQHCPEPNQAPAGKGALADCAMACAAALPAQDLTPTDAPPTLRSPVEPTFIPALSGIEMELATPPPRLS